MIPADAPFLKRRAVLAAGVTVALAGCTAHAPYSGPFDPVRPPDALWTMADGAAIPVRIWPADGVTVGIILALHGFDDSRDGWTFAAPAFAAAGWGLYAPDARGFGAAPGRGRWPGTATLVSDAAAHLARLRAVHGAVPTIVVGESMGGATALLLAAQTPGAADRYILSAPAVWTRGQMGPALSGTLWAARRLAPDWRLTGGEIPLDIAPTDNREALRALLRDPLTIRETRVRAIAGLADLMDAAAAATPSLPNDGRVLWLAGRRDQLIPPAATVAAWARAPAAVRRAFYPNGYHLLFRDRDRTLVIGDTLAWLRDPAAYLPSGADAATAAWLANGAWRGDPSLLLPSAEADGFWQRPVWPY